MGRTVQVPDRIERVMPAGPPAAVLLYTIAPEKMIGWPHSPGPAAKSLLGPGFADLPQLTPLVRDGKVPTEQIQASRPDVILDYGSTAARYADRATMVQEATGIPVLLLDGKHELTPEIYRLLGAMLGTAERRPISRAPPSACSRSPARGLRRGVKQGRSGSITPAARTGSRPRPRPPRWATCSASSIWSTSPTAPHRASSRM
jgi:iron complex transport system substrate-binding protein